MSLRRQREAPCAPCGTSPNLPNLAFSLRKLRAAPLGMIPTIPTHYDGGHDLNQLAANHWWAIQRVHVWKTKDGGLPEINGPLLTHFGNMERAVITTDVDIATGAFYNNLEGFGSRESEAEREAFWIRYVWLAFMLCDLYDGDLLDKIDDYDLSSDACPLGAIDLIQKTDLRSRSEKEFGINNDPDAMTQGGSHRVTTWTT